MKIQVLMENTAADASLTAEHGLSLYIETGARSCTYYTGHCTGEAAFAFLKARMGDRLHAIPAGTTMNI